MIKSLLNESQTLNIFFRDYVSRKEIFETENPSIVKMSPKATFFNFVYGAPNHRSYLYDYFEGIDNTEFFAVMNEMQSFVMNEIGHQDIFNFNRLFGEYANVGLSFGTNYQYRLYSNLFNILRIIDENL